MSSPPQRTSPIELSVIVLAWDNLELTRRCVESIRTSTSVPYELIIVDNGSTAEAASWAAEAADTVILHDSNLGFAKGMNAGLAVAAGQSVAFVNNDTILPSGWDSPLLETLRDPGRKAGIVVPSSTNAGNRSTVRSATSDLIRAARPFRDLPSGVVYVMETATIRALGGWNERYPIASAEDVDLLFTVWCNGLEVVHDERVLVEHVGGATADTQLDDKGRIWRENRQLLVGRWQEISDDDVPKLAGVDESLRQARLAQARIAAWWMGRAFDSMDQFLAQQSRSRKLAERLSQAERQAAMAQRRWWQRPKRGSDPERP